MAVHGHPMCIEMILWIYLTVIFHYLYISVIDSKKKGPIVNAAVLVVVVVYL